MAQSPYIHADQTRENYVNICKSFGRWVEQTYTVKGDLQQALSHTAEWVQLQGNVGTQKAYACALAKGFGVSSQQVAGGQTLGQRHGRDISRGRGSSVHTERVQRWEQAHPQEAEALRSCGLRRSEAEALTGADVTPTADGGCRVYVQQGKGGLSRWVDVSSGAGAQWLVSQAQSVGATGAVFGGVNLTHANAHGYRADYAQRAYQEALQSGKGTGELYRPRDGSGSAWDRGAMSYVNAQMGHGDDRCYTLYYNYLSYGKI